MFALTLLRFSGVGADDDLDSEWDLLVLWAPFDLFDLEEEEEPGGDVWRWREVDEEEVDEEWEGRLCDDEEGNVVFFFFLTDVGASYVRKDSKDIMGVSKSSSSSSFGGESFGARGRPGNTEVNGRGCGEFSEGFMDAKQLVHW